MKNDIVNLLQLFGFYWRVKRSLRVQKNYLKTTTGPAILAIRKRNDGSLREQDFKKIEQYYGLAVPALLGEGFCLLYGVQMNRRERSALTYLGAITGLFDDFIDEKGLSDERISQLLHDPKPKMATDAHESLYIEFYLKLFQHLPHPELVLKYMEQVYHAQLHSKRQTIADLDESEIKAITDLKGGASLLLYRSVLDGFPDAVETKLLYQLGGLMQLENDLFDIYKDAQAQIKTLATTATQMHDLRIIYQGAWEDIVIQAAQTSFRLKNRKRFLRYMALVICRGMVCLDVLEANQTGTNNRFEVSKYSRKELICDMEQPKNYILAIRYYLRLTAKL